MIEKEDVRRRVINIFERVKKTAEENGNTEKAESAKKSITFTYWFTWFYYRWELKDVRLMYYKKNYDLIIKNREKLQDILIKKVSNEETFRKMEEEKISKKLINMFKYFEHISRLMDIYYIMIPELGYDEDYYLKLPEVGYDGPYSFEVYDILASWRNSKTAGEAIEKMMKIEELSENKTLMNKLLDYIKKFNFLHSNVNWSDIVWKMCAAIELDYVEDAKGYYV